MLGIDGQSDRRTGGPSTQTDFTGVRPPQCGASSSSLGPLTFPGTPAPVSPSWGHTPFLDILGAKPWPEMGIPSSTPYSDSAEPTGLNKGPSPFLKSTLVRTSCSSSFQPPSNGLLHVSPWPSEDHWAPGPARPGAETGGTEKLLRGLICLFTPTWFQKRLMWITKIHTAQ